MARRLRRPAPPMGAGAILLRTVVAAALLVLGFLAMQTGPALWLFARIAEAIAAVSEFVLALLGAGLSREGIVLRSLETGEAVAVTPACDGHGLIIALAAMLGGFLAPRVGWRRAARVAVLAFLAIEAFNLARVGVLYWVGPADEETFAAAHYLAFPLASSVLVAMLGAALLPAELRAAALGRIAAIGIVAAVAAVPWALYGEEIAALVLVPVADAWLGLIGPDLVEGLRQFGSETVVATRMVTGRDPVSYLSVPLEPAHFMLPLPLIAGAAVLLLRHPVALACAVAAALAAMGLALALAAVNGAHESAAASGLGDLLMREAEIYLTTRPYAPPGDVAMALLPGAQNAAVHFNLFLLPFLLPAALTRAGRSAMAAALTRA